MTITNDMIVHNHMTGLCQLVFLSVLIVNILLIQWSGKLEMVSDFNIDLTCNLPLLLGGEARPP